MEKYKQEERYWHFDNDATSKIVDVLLEHSELPHVLPLAVQLEIFCWTSTGGLQHFSVSPRHILIKSKSGSHRRASPKSAPLLKSVKYLVIWLRGSHPR